MLKVNGTSLSSSGIMVIVLSYAIGTLLGTFAKLEEKIERFGDFLKEKANRQNDNNFITAFVVSSLTVCVGAMAVIGAIQDGINQDISILIAKSILDFVIMCARHVRYLAGVSPVVELVGLRPSLRQAGWGDLSGEGSRRQTSGLTNRNHI